MVRYWQKGAAMSKGNSCGLGKTGNIMTLVGAGIHLLPTPGANFRPGQLPESRAAQAGSAAPAAPPAKPPAPDQRRQCRRW